MTGKPWTEEQKEERRLARLARSGDLIGDEGPEQGYEETPEEYAMKEPPPEPDVTEKLLANISPEVAALFSKDEIAAIVKKATDDALNEKKKRALKDLQAKAATQARVEQGLVSQDVIRSAEEQARLDEIVTWRCNLPEGGGDGLRLDGKVFRHGELHTTTRAVYATAAAMMYQSWVTEFRFKGLKHVEQMRDFRSPEIEVSVH